MTTIVPMGDRILIRRIPHDDREHPLPNGASLWLPKLPPEAPMVCEVLAVGPGKRTAKGVRIPIPLTTGDKVLIGRWAGTDVAVDGETFRLLDSDEVIGIVEGSGRLTVME